VEWTEVSITVPVERVDEAGDIAQMVVPYGIYIEDYSMLEDEVQQIAHIDLIDEDLKNCTGLFQGKKRKELQAQSNKYAETIKIMKQGLSHIVQDYKYPTVDAFLQVYKQGKSEYESYVKANKEWNSKYGENSIHRKLAEKQAEVQKREQDRDFNYRSPSDRGAR